MVDIRARLFYRTDESARSLSGAEPCDRFAIRSCMRGYSVPNSAPATYGPTSREWQI